MGKEVGLLKGKDWFDVGFTTGSLGLARAHSQSADVNLPKNLVPQLNLDMPDFWTGIAN